MSKVFDLHSHSTASDGTLTPTQLVEQAAAAGVEVLALTDHDTLDGIAEAEGAAQAAGIDLWPGVEVSVTWNRVAIHLVGLRVDPQHPGLNRGLEGLRDFRAWRAREIARRLEQKGIAGAYEGARALSNGRLISRTHFARWLVQQGYVSEERKVYRKYLTRGKPGHVAGQWARLADAVEWIHAAGGRAVIAHPARYKVTRSKLRELLQEFVDVGGEGLEVVSGSHSVGDCFAMAKLAVDFGLAASAGSDYHGPEANWRGLGRLPSLPDGVRAIWQGW